ncbi:hypothetical protein QKB11_gp7 [human papillomavirus 11]|uniref:Probable protein E5B n=41 Tax=Alphapapillomavirus 10 TaxID=333754 RepID=VE5B_HPV11|nr:RecName: Full=Probable protein E5B [Human papillomavirus type 6c]P69901.1 RecName: Full=Probable protein E5B [human papillomavirus 11]AAA47013.1 E5b protein [Human papillomavirus]CRH87626.1 Uncharacterised protein [Chlamydia trachomatis]AAA46933.1 4146 is position of first start codon in ORF E5B; putative [human papillomavirus 11]ACL12348.1 E5B [human papillomavirus 11]AFC88066.1 E5B [human papillomavirus 11]
MVMLTCHLNDGDTWLFLWLFTAFVVAVLGLLLLHYRAVHGTEKTKCAKCKSNRNTTVDYVYMSHGDNGDYVYMN